MNWSFFWHGWLLGSAAASTIGAVTCIVMLLATDRLVFLPAYLLCVAGARIFLHLEKKHRP